MKPLEGIRVVEVAAWTFVPAAGAVLAEWGAEVLKIEHPDGGDPQRGLVSSGLIPGGDEGINFFVEQPNHNKKSVAINLRHPAGRAALYRLCETADVFLTNFLPPARQRAEIDVEHIRAVNPGIIYVRGSGQGVRGPDADKGGYDASAYFARSGILDAMMSEDDDYGPTQPPAFGDFPGGQAVAGSVAAALFKRERSGETSIVDVSLLSFGMWSNSPNIIMSKLMGVPFPKMPRESLSNPIVNRYLTNDGRLIQLVMLQGVRFWPELLTALGREDLAADERFATAESQFENRVEGTRLLDEIFGALTFDDAKARLAEVSGVWAPVQKGLDLFDDVQVQANGYIADVEAPSGTLFPLVANPAQFNEEPADLSRAPELGEHTDDTLLSLGYSMDEVLQMKIESAIL